MKWETIKLKARQIANDRAANLYSLPAAEDPAIAAVLMSLENHKPWRDNLEALVEAVDERIRTWDVRLCAKLRDCFPEAFPGGLKSGPLCAYEADTPGAEWMIEAA